jgi:hypothetical protein
MKLFSKRMGQDSIWTRELIPADSVLRKDLIRQDSILRKDLFAFAKFTSPCLSCPILMVADKRVCNRYDRIRRARPTRGHTIVTGSFHFFFYSGQVSAN